jgi:hypothetical protein
LYHAKERSEMPTKFLSENCKRKRLEEHVSIYGRIMGG